MLDSYDKWNDIKKRLEKNSFIHTKIGEIYNAQLGMNVGYEQSGKGKQFLRPILVFKKFSKSTVLAMPLSTTNRRGKYYFEFNFIPDKVSVAILSQIRLIDTRRLYKKLGRIKTDDFRLLNEKFNEL